MTSRIAGLARHFSKMAAAKTPTDITLYTVNTPNGIKASILLEELNLAYKVAIPQLLLNELFPLWGTES